MVTKEKALKSLITADATPYISLCDKINSDFSDVLQKIICARELEYAVFHARKAGVNAFHDFTFFDGTSHKEYEANLFAAELLMPDELVMAELNDDSTFFGAVAKLQAPEEFLDFEFCILKR